MGQEYEAPVRVYKYPFEMVMAAYERRFPRCPLIPVVVECVTTEDHWSDDDSRRMTTRRCQLNVDAPYLLKKMMGVDYVYFIQKNELDLRERQLLIEATNETFLSRVSVVENCRYFVHPDNDQWTCFEMRAALDVKSFFGFENSIEKIAMKQYSANIAKGKEVMEVFMREVNAEGVTSLAPWSEDTPDDNMRLRELLCRGAPEMSATSLVVGSNQLSETDKKKAEGERARQQLGELSALQEARLQQLRKWIADLQKGKVPSDGTLVRFLKARDFNVEKAREMLSASLVWRKRHQVDRILAEYETPQVVRDYFPGGWHHHDKDGRPLYVLRLGQMDVKGLLKSIGEDGLLKLTLHVCEEGLRLLSEASRQGARAVQSWCLLVDLDGLNMRHLWRPGVRALLRIIQIVEANYPETMGRVLIVRAPRVFPILWTIVSTFIDDNTRSKFLFYGGKDYLQPGGLLDYLQEDLIPDFLGGPCKASIIEPPAFVPHWNYESRRAADFLIYSFVHEGGLVPKSQYAAGVFLERSDGDPLSEDSIYCSVSLHKGQVHEVLVHNNDPSSVLTWDFDVVRQDLAFTVFRTTQPPPDTVDNGEVACSLGLGGGGVGVVGGGGAGEAEAREPGRSVLEANGWREGTHYHRVEPTILCHDGESIQGSHVMTERGCYVLQWRWQAPPELLDSFTHAHRAQLMYFHETLTSRDYKGSMWSLQSGASGFSVLSSKSMASSCPSR